MFYLVCVGLSGLEKALNIAMPKVYEPFLEVCISFTITFSNGGFHTVKSTLNAEGCFRVTFFLLEVCYINYLGFVLGLSYVLKHDLLIECLALNK